MDAPEPERKRLKHVAERLEELHRLDMVKSLGERGLGHVVLQILQYLTLGEIWEVISHSVQLRQWLHRQGVWKLLAEQRVPEEKRDAFVARLKKISSVKTVNWFWYLCVEDTEAVKTASGIYVQPRVATSGNHVLRGFNFPHAKDKLEFLVPKMDNDLFFTMLRAFPKVQYKFYNGDSYVEIKIKDKSRAIFESEATVKGARDAFLYLVLARGGSVLVYIENPDWEIDSDSITFFLDDGDKDPFYEIQFIRSELHD